MSKNIDDFNEVVGLVFAQLLEAFPTRVHVDDQAIARTMEVTIGPLPRDEMVFSPTRVVQFGKLTTGMSFETFMMDTLRWLQQEGFVIEDHGQYTLAARALHVLNASPASLDRTLGSKLTDAVKDAGSETGRAMIGQTVGLILGAAARGWSGP